MATTGHENEAVNVQGLKAALQKFKTDKVTAAGVGLGNVGNFKAVSTVASQGLSSTEKSNARANIGAGTGNGTITGIKMNGASKGSSGVVDLGTVITVHQDISGKVDKTTTVNGHELSGNVTVTKSDVGLGNVTNDAQVKRTEMGVASGVATLDSAGKVPSSQLPSYVDDVLEYDTKSAFPETGEAGKIYVDKSTNATWRWSGSAYTQIKGDLAIGTTTGTAADGGVANAHYNNTSNPHSVTKSQVGLGSVVNTGDSATPVSGGTTKFTTGGAYTELAKKVDKVSGKGLSTNDYTTDEKNKLAGIAAGAEVNVQSDWNATSGDAFIKNKPTIPDSFQWFGTSSTAADTVQKEVSIPSITSLKTGQIIVVQPTVTSSVANSTLKLNSFDAYPMRYANAAITTSTDSMVWSASYPSLFVFDGSYWVFLGHGFDTTYSAMPVAEGTAGTKTTARTMRADYLKQIIQALAPQSDWDATSGDAQILNKPTIPAAVAVKGNAETSYRTGNVNITPANIGLGNVGDFKAVSTVASQGLSSTEKSNARANIGAGTSSLALGTTSTTALKGDTKYAASSSAGGDATNSDKIDGYHILVVSSMPASPDENTIYIVK